MKNTLGPMVCVLVLAACSAHDGAATGATSADLSSGHDGKPPSAPVPSVEVGRTSARITWPASTDNVGVAGYDVWVDGALVYTGPSTSFAKDDLVCATPLSFAVDAFDAAGNHSAAALVTVRTRPCLDSWADVRDFFVQDVCLDAKNRVISGVSPLDGNPACVAHRDLLPGESLPYHKNGVGADERLLDEFPVETHNPAAGIIAMKIKAGGDLAPGDGPANVYLQSGKTFSSYSTIDGNGPTYHVASNCAGGVPILASLFDTKVRVDIDALHASSGLGSTYGLGFAKVYNPSPTCPDADEYHHGTSNVWFFATYTYPTAGGGTTAPLQTLVSDDDPDDDDDKRHVEVYYQTREIGRTRYEAFQNVAGRDQDYKDYFYKLHDKLVASGQCNPLALAPPPSGPGTEWVEYECRLYTETAAPADPAGDSPQEWVDIAKAANMLAPVFGVKPTDNPEIDDISPSTIPWGYAEPITITGKGFGNQWFGKQNIVMFNGGGIHFRVESDTGRSRIVFTIEPGDWEGSRKLHTVNCGNKAGNAIHVFDGVSMSTPGRIDIDHCPE